MEENENEEMDEDRAMAWKRLRPSALRVLSQSMFIGGLISLLTAAIVGLLYILISYLCYKTLLNYQFEAPNSIPVHEQWIRTISGLITTLFIYLWYFVNLLFLFRPFQLVGVKKKTGFSFHSCLLPRCTLRVALQALQISHSFTSLPLKIPLSVIFLNSVFLQIYLVTNHVCTRSRKEKVSLSFQLIAPGCSTVFISIIADYLIYPAYNNQNKDGKLLIALFAPLIGVVVKVLNFRSMDA